MKALLLKDFYMTAKYCRSYLLIIAIFTAVSIFSPESSFFSAYICLIIGLLPVTLFAYDEKSKWNEYCGALPYGKAQMVVSKYLIGILGQIAAIFLSMLINTAVNGFDGIEDLFSVYGCGLAASCTAVGIILPFIFALGSEKGRIAYYIILAAVFAVIFATTNIFGGNRTSEPPVSGFSFNIWTLVLGGITLYAVSCIISVIIYKRKEVK